MAAKITDVCRALQKAKRYTRGILTVEKQTRSKPKPRDFNRRLQTGLALIISLVVPMLYSPQIESWILKTALVVATVEWLQSGAKWIGLLLWIVPCILHVDEVLNEWPGRIVTLETLWIVLVYSDSAQLVIGRRFGRTPAIPSISPNKSLEGYIGGILASLLVAVFVHGWAVVPTLVILIAGVVGDLYFSLFKRFAGIKDYSTILGSHGGLCDRIDSFVFAILALYYWGSIVSIDERNAFLQGRRLPQ